MRRRFAGICAILLYAVASCLLLLLCVGHAVNHVLLAGLLTIDQALDTLHPLPEPVDIEGAAIPIPVEW